MRPPRFTGRSALALLAGLIVLTGCSHDAGAGSSHGTGSPPGAAKQRPDPVSALTHGLSERVGAASYYLSLGDSLSQGVQPGPTGHDVATAHGYPDQLAAMLRTHLPHLRLVKLGCSGETT